MFSAKAVADMFNRGLFETYLELSCVPFLAEPMTSSSISAVTNQLTIADVMARGVSALPPVIAIPELLHILESTSFSVNGPPNTFHDLSSAALLRHIVEATLSLFLSPGAAADFPVPLPSFLILS